MTAILISRFLLDLQAVRRRTEAGSISEPVFTDLDSAHSTYRSLVFDRVVGSLGASIPYERGSVGVEREIVL
ncbi:hypothetical protein L226DRAFT_536622, partial [Lentinus tigrinus ALCF2SS1-7]